MTRQMKGLILSWVCLSAHTSMQDVWRHGEQPEEVREETAACPKSEIKQRRQLELSLFSLFKL